MPQSHWPLPLLVLSHSPEINYLLFTVPYSLGLLSSDLQPLLPCQLEHGCQALSSPAELWAQPRGMLSAPGRLLLCSGCSGALPRTRKLVCDRLQWTTRTMLGRACAAVRAKGAECFREPPTESRPTAGFKAGKGCLPPGSCLVLPVEAGSCQSSSCPGARVVPDQGSLWLAQHGRDVQPLNKAFSTFYFPGWGDLWTSGLTPAAAREGPGFVLHLLWNKTTSLWQGTSSHE